MKSSSCDIDDTLSGATCGWRRFLCAFRRGGDVAPYGAVVFPRSPQGGYASGSCLRIRSRLQGISGVSQGMV